MTRSSAAWATLGSPGPKLVAGTPRAAKRATSVQPSLARGGPPLASTSDFSRGWPRPGGAATAKSTTSNPSTSPTISRNEASASSGDRSGAKRWLRTTVARSGTTLPATPPSMPTADSASRNTHPSISTLRPPNAATAVSTGPRRWMALTPSQGRAEWARTPVWVTTTRIVPWQPASIMAPVGSARTAASAATRSGRSRNRRSMPLYLESISSHS